jgi:hypothetical protein
MSRLQTIENRLKEINGTVFQELCDSYLTIRDNNYLAISRTGSQTGKQKTTKGTPDTFFQLPNGNFLYCEITTDTSTKNKLANDIKHIFRTLKNNSNYFLEKTTNSLHFDSLRYNSPLSLSRFFQKSIIKFNEFISLLSFE